MKSKAMWFRLLPPKIKAKARRNTKNAGKDALNYVSDCLSSALMSSFVWNQTPEGHNFWSKLYDSIKTKELEGEL